VSDHLPECFATDPIAERTPTVCLCDRLRSAMERQRAKDYVSVWSRVMLEEGKYRYALVRAALVIRGRLTDADVLRLTGHVVSVSQWEEKARRSDVHARGVHDENRRIRDGVLEYYKVAPKAAEPMLRIIDKEAR
jgi:hypothetical protein